MNFDNIWSGTSESIYNTVSKQQIQKWLQRPITYNKQLRNLSMYWYGLKGVINRTYEMYKNMHSLDSSLSIDNPLKEDFKDCEKREYKLFDFFANCEYFEEKFNYDEILKLPAKGIQKGQEGGTETIVVEPYETLEPDKILTFNEQIIGAEGMRIVS